jgi:mxaJ protein
MMRTTKPYYRSGHVFVWRKDSNYNITDWTSPDLHKGFIGVIDHSPATIPMNDNKLIANARPYRIQRDLNLPPSFMIDDLAKGDIDIAIAWGPIGGYFAKNSKVPMEVKLIPEYENTNVKGKEYWNISVGVRKKDKDRMEMIQGALDRNQDKIIKILDDYGIPHVAVVEGDSVQKVYRNRNKN